MTSLLATLAFPVLMSFASTPGVEPLDGKAVFLARKCNMCHSVAVVDIKATLPEGAAKIVDVSGMSAKYKAEWLALYLRKQEKIVDKVHPTKFKGDDPELDAMVKWLMSLPPAKPAK